MMNNGDKNEITAYLDAHGVVDKDSGVPVKRQGGYHPQKRKTGRMKPGGAPVRKVIDLHGKTRQQAIMILSDAISRCRKDNIRSLLIIHGKGKNSDPDEGPVLGDCVRALLRTEYARVVKDFTSALPRDGGEGATLVELRAQE
jgi:DNA-nicking Smr family endonuclease